MFQVMLTESEIACSCADWVRHCLPCKHIFAVAKQKFLSLPEGYRNCIEFNSSVQLDKSRPHCSITSFSGNPTTPGPDDISESCAEMAPELESLPSADIGQGTAADDETIVPPQDADLMELPTTAKVHMIQCSKELGWGQAHETERSPFWAKMGMGIALKLLKMNPKPVKSLSKTKINITMMFCKTSSNY